MLRRVIKFFAVALLALFVVWLVLCTASTTPLGRASIVVVPLGWVRFIARTFPNVTVNWSGVAMVALCSALVIFVLHRFLSWLYVAIAPRASVQERPSTWPRRWTFVLFGFLWILFGIAIGASGAMRQTTWLIELTEPVYKPRLNGYSELRMASGEVATALLESGDDIQRAQKILMTLRQRGFGAWDHHQFLFLTNANNRIDIVIIPRDPEMQQKAGFLFLSDKGQQQLPISELLGVLHGNAIAPGEEKIP